MLGVVIGGVGTAGAANPTSCTRVITGSSGPITVNGGELVCIYKAVVSGSQLGRAIDVKSGGGLVVSSSVVRDGEIASDSGAFFIAVCASSTRDIEITSNSGPTVIGWRAQGCGGNDIAPTDVLNVAYSTGQVIMDGNNFRPQGATTWGWYISYDTGGVQLTQNQISGALTCLNDSPTPTGFGNVAASKFGQCASV